MPEPIVGESIAAEPSLDNGNVPVDVPDAQPNPPAAPADPASPEAKPASPAVPELYELPDGRKVDGATLSKEWKENFLPDYTRKSQALARDKASEQKVPLQENKPANPFADPAYAPQTYEELARVIRESTLAELDAKEQSRVAERQAIEDTVSAQLTEVKTLDPSVNENALFLHATKYGFKDLKMAHQNMKDMASMVKTVQKNTETNILKRQDPVSIVPGANGVPPNPNNFSTAREYLRSLK